MPKRFNARRFRKNNLDAVKKHGIEDEMFFVLDDWVQDNCDGMDPFKAITWYRNKYCTMHNTHKCEPCTDRERKRSDRNTSIASRPLGNPEPILDGWSWFRQAWVQGYRTVEESRQIMKANIIAAATYPVPPTPEETTDSTSGIAAMSASSMVGSSAPFNLNNHLLHLLRLPLPLRIAHLRLLLE